MSRDDKKYYYYAEITIEAVTPLVLASGKSGNFFDVELVRDANGLPAIPGSTIAGILRHAFKKEADRTTAELFFGYQKGKDGYSSSLEVSWAYVHDSKNCSHKYYYPESKIGEDPILSELYIIDNSDFKRDHVSLNNKGVTKGSEKFDRCFVPVGCRFSFSLGLWTEEKEDKNWNKMLGILYSPSFRIGSAGRAGYGKIKVVEIKTPSNDCFDLSKLEDIQDFKKCTKKCDLNKFLYEPKENEIEKLKLKFPLGFRVGGGIESIFDPTHIPDILPYCEKVIKWTEDTGTFKERSKITIPGSALKGALRHRAAYHLARIKKNWAQPGEFVTDDGLSEIFGNAANNSNSEQKGQAGKLWFTDLYLEETNTYELSRNSIDRFTGGTLNGVLFQEENVNAGTTIETCIYLDKAIKNNSDEYKAFKWALEDLKAGRLALGGGSGHGLGFNYAEEEK